MPSDGAIMTAFELFALLILGHYVADYPMQGQFIALGKNRTCPIPGTPWYQILTAHAVMHGGLVAVAIAAAGLTAHAALFSVVLPIAMAEALCHWIIDDWKCRSEAKNNALFAGEELERRKTVAYNLDQALHVLCKFVWASVCVAAAGMPLLWR